MATKADMFKPENAQPDPKEHLSPSGRYKLTVTGYATKPGCWNYSRGVVTNVATGAVLADIQRNYSSFPFTWIEGHANGHDYFVGGEDYQGQSVVELDTGKRRDLLPEEAKKGAGFCWAKYRYEASRQLLVVEGCYWACPYEYRFYDFSDPMNGWPHVEVKDGYIDDDDRPPVFNDDGTITCFQTGYVEDDSDDEDEESEEKLGPLAATKTFRREGLQLILVNEWVSEAEQARRKADEEARIRYEAWLADFKANDPLYLAMLDGLKDPTFQPDSYHSVGFTYQGWCPGFSGSENRMCRRIHDRKKNPGYTLDLEWGVKTGPVKLVVYKDGKHVEDKFWMEHAAASIVAAYAHAKQLLTGGAS